ncbi:Putative F-box/LRR-repeat protein At5g02930 [Linum grandiflorum]
MNKKKKNKRRSGKQLGIAGGLDRITNLPDSILHHIISILDTKSAVKTSVLSKQWKSVWKHVHSLNLELNFNEYARYARFVDNVLSLRYPLHVSKVLLLWNLGACPAAPDDWFSLLRRLFRYAVSHGAQHFNIRLRINLYIPLLELFDSISDTVRTLELVRFDLDCQPERSAFRLLTTLKLYDCWFSTEDELVEPFSQFPFLKDLVLDDCSWLVSEDEHRIRRLRISGLELVNLTITRTNVWNFELFAPKLESLVLCFVEFTEFSELTLPSLVYADIGCPPFDEDDDNVIEHLVVMFRGLHNVECLILGKEISKAVRRMSKFLEQQPCPFTKLKKLNLELDSNDDVPYKVLDSYFNNVASNAGLHIQIGEEVSISPDVLFHPIT